MKKAILMLALFPFLHGQSYAVDYVSCEENEIVVAHEDENVRLSLFNTKIIKKEGWNQTCSLMKKAKKIRIEIDPSSKVEEPMQAYIFVDDILLQEELIKNKYAYIMIHNPEYTYEKRLEEAAETTGVMAKANSKAKDTHKHAMVAPLYFAAALCLWLLMLFILLYRRKHKHQKHQ